MNRSEMEMLSLSVRRRVHWAQALIVVGVTCTAPLAYSAMGGEWELADLLPVWAVRVVSLFGLVMPIAGLWLLLGILRGYLKRDEILIERMSGQNQEAADPSSARTAL